MLRFAPPPPPPLWYFLKETLVCTLSPGKHSAAASTITPGDRLSNSPLPLSTSPERSELEANAFDMITELLRTCVYTIIVADIYVHEIPSYCQFECRYSMMMSLVCYTVSCQLIYSYTCIYRCWGSPHRGTDSPESWWGIISHVGSGVKHLERGYWRSSHMEILDQAQYRQLPLVEGPL